ncbi:MAG TPA: hypothetical protein VIN08_16675 [Ohtaekwangia sp.]|uniref:hypothetical protein n=1 Tax=Ohtaekwangia sp. TaxID=2066019 RepID=UPI002F936959
MVRLIFIAFLLLNTFCEAQFYSKITIDHIRIDHVGPGDAMLEPIIITTEKLELPFPERPIQVDKHIFECLVEYLKHAKLLPKREINEFGVFKVTERIGTKTEIYFTGTQKKSVDFLKGFKKLLKDVRAPDELIKKTERVLKRIDYLH